MSTPSRLEDAKPPASPLKVSVALSKAVEISFAHRMSLLRNWLDRHSIEPDVFRYYDRESGSQIYEVISQDRHQADLFAAEFDAKHLR